MVVVGHWFQLLSRVVAHCALLVLLSHQVTQKNSKNCATRRGKMTHIFDTKNKAWDSAKDGTIWKVDSDTEIPVTVFLQWFEGGWNRIYEVRIGLTNAGRILEVSKRDSKVAKSILSPKSPYYSDIPIEFLERVPTIVAGLQRDIEGTRQAVQLLRDEMKQATSSGSLSSFWPEDDHSSRAIVAFRFQKLLHESGVVPFRSEAFRILNFKDTAGSPISLRTFTRLVKKGERLVNARNNKKEGKK